MGSRNVWRVLLLLVVSVASASELEPASSGACSTFSTSDAYSCHGIFASLRASSPDCTSRNLISSVSSEERSETPMPRQRRGRSMSRKFGTCSHKGCRRQASFGTRESYMTSLMRARICMHRYMRKFRGYVREALCCMSILIL
jgi:hypothetical protein